MTLLQIAYVLDIMGSVPVAFTTLIGHERAARFLFKECLPESESFRIILDSLWMAVLLCCIAGFFFPIYKGLWLIVSAVPRWIGGRGAEVPKRIAGICLATVFAFPWIFPWSMLLASKQ